MSVEPGAGTAIHDGVDLPVPIDRAWQLLTHEEHLPGWLCDAGADVDPRPGGNLTLRWIRLGEFAGTIVAFDPMRRFAYRWMGPPGSEADETNSTLVELSLEALPSGTRVHLTERGFELLTVPEDVRQRVLDENRSGWRGAMEELLRYATELDRPDVGQE